MKVCLFSTSLCFKASLIFVNVFSMAAALSQIVFVQPFRRERFLKTSSLGIFEARLASYKWVNIRQIDPICFDSKKHQETVDPAGMA